MSSPKTALVSWAHSDPGWDERVRERRQADVRAFTDVLRTSGIDAEVDLYHFNEGVDWSRWGPSMAMTRDFVLVVCSQSWRRAWEGSGDLTANAGAAAEADVLKSLYGKDRDEFVRRVRLVVLPDGAGDDVPTGLHGVTRYQLSSIDAAGMDGLLRDLTGQPRIPAPTLGPVLDLPPEPPTPNSRSATDVPAGGTASGGLRFRRLTATPTITWRADWDRSANQGTASLTAHCVQVPAVGVSSREFLGAADRVQHVMRSSGLVPSAAGLSTQVERRSVVVAVDTARRGYGEVDPGTLIGVRHDQAGQVSVMQTLPNDSMGAVFDDGQLTTAVADALTLVSGVWGVGAVDLAVAVECNSVTMITSGGVADLGRRSSASFPWGFSEKQLRHEPDESIGTNDLVRDREQIARSVVPVALQAWQLR